MAIKPKSCIIDEWLMIQIKSTEKPTRHYSFKCSEKYKDCIIVCLCISDQNMWIFDGNVISVNKTVAIGLKKSKYEKNKVNADNMSSFLLETYKDNKKFKFDDINVPISTGQQTESIFRQLRENNTKQALVYDFKINDLKIQEKVGCLSEKKCVYFSLHKNNGSLNGKRTLTSYKQSDNDFYWLHSPCKRFFWIIPEEELINRGYINTPKKHSLLLKAEKYDKWYYKYQYSYDEQCHQKISEIFS